MPGGCARRIQRGRDRERRAAFGQREQFARMLEHAHVRIRVGQMRHLLGRMHGGPAPRARPAVPVAGHAAVLERDRMQHRGFRPPRQHVVPFETAARRIGAVAQQRAVELGRDRAGHAQLDEIGFVGDRRKRAAVQVEYGHRVACPVSSRRSTAADCRAPARARGRARRPASRRSARPSARGRSRTAHARLPRNSAGRPRAPT